MRRIDDALAHWAFGRSRLLEQVTHEAREQFMPGLMAGTHSMSFGLSEPNAGSDASMVKTRAEKDGDGWRISGRKIWTSNAPIADYCVVFAVTDAELAAKKRGGISAFMVPTSSPGFEIQRVIKLFGHIGGDEAEISLDEERVEPWQLVGELNQGFAAALYGVSIGRIYNSARLVGYGRWAVELALDYAKSREAFGKGSSVASLECRLSSWSMPLTYIADQLTCHRYDSIRLEQTFHSSEQRPARCT